MTREGFDKWKRENIQTNVITGQTTVDGVAVGRQLWIGTVVKNFIKEETVVIRASSEAEFHIRLLLLSIRRSILMIL